MAAYGHWIPSEIFDHPPKRSLNLHPSLLPRHRGAAPVVSTILSGEKEVGISVLFVEDEMDTGDLLAQIKLPIQENDTTGSVMSKCAEAGGRFFVDTIAGWVDGKIVPKPQDHSLATWFGRMKKEEGLINWTLPAEEIVRRCHALSPWPGAYTFFEGRRLIIRQASVLNNPSGYTVDSEPGRIVCIDSEVGVITGDGLLRIDILQLSCRKPLILDEFLRGQRHFIGTRLGY
ncbi:Methionyl-tRNA formyltransferase [subsurface metagenome]